MSFPGVPADRPQRRRQGNSAQQQPAAELSVNELKLFNSLPLLLKHTGQVTCTFDARSGRGGGGN